MQGKATIGGQPIHAALVPIPIGAFAVAAIGDVASIWYDHAFLAAADTWLIGVGVVTALAAGIFGFVDYLWTPLTEPAKRIAGMHMALNAGVVLVFGVALAQRLGARRHRASRADRGAGERRHARRAPRSHGRARLAISIAAIATGAIAAPAN